MIRTIYLLIGIAGLVASSFTNALAVSYPSKPITIVLPFPAGGTPDPVARIAAEVMSKDLGVQVIVDNRVGASGTIGTRHVAQSQPDGYTLLFSDPAPLVFSKFLRPSLPYDPQRDFMPLGQFVSMPFVIASHPSTGFKTLRDLIKAAKEKPGTFKYGHGGIGSSPHLAALLLEKSAGIKLVQVPYQSGTASTQDAVAGHTNLVVTVPGQVRGLIENGALVPLAVSSKARSPVFPTVPTVSESGVPGYEAVIWFGLFGPKGMSKEVVDKVVHALSTVSQNETFKQRMSQLGMDPVVRSGDDFILFVNDEYKKWGPIIAETGIKLN